MKKLFLLKQLYRAELIAINEMIEHEQSKNEISIHSWIPHEKGHLKAINYIRKLLEEKNIIEKKKLKKRIRKKIADSLNLIHLYDVKYNNFENDEEMEKEDHFMYHFLDGMICELTTFIHIINQKRYYWK